MSSKETFFLALFCFLFLLPQQAAEATTLCTVSSELASYNVFPKGAIGLLASPNGFHAIKGIFYLPLF